MNSPTHKLLTCNAPIDRIASQGLAYKVATPRTFGECPTLYPGSFRDLQKRIGAFWEDITNWKTVNGMTAVGLISIDQKQGCGRSKWAVLCSCGNYEIRQYRDFRAKCRGGHPDWCDQCFTKWVNAKHRNPEVGAGNTASTA